MSHVAVAFLGLLLVHALGAEFAVGVLAPITSNSPTYLAATVCFDIDWRKNFEPELIAKHGPPIVQIPDPHPDLRNISVRVHTSNSQSSVGIASFIDMLLGLDGGTPVSALIGGFHSAISMQVANVAAAKKIPQVSFGSTNPSLSNKEDYPYFLRTLMPDTGQAEAMWTWIIYFQVPVAFVIYSDEPYGKGTYDALVRKAESEGEGRRLNGAGVLHMPTNYDELEAERTLNFALASGCKFLIMVLTADQATYLFPVMSRFGMLGDDWQILGGEDLRVVPGINDFTPEDLPTGFMKWYPESRGSQRIANLYESLWESLSMEDVLQPRYGVQNFKVGLNDGVVKMDESTFQASRIYAYSFFLFDAGYALIFAVNRLLHSGVPLGDIRGELLLNELWQNTRFQGVSGEVYFNEFGDRPTNFNLQNWQPTANGLSFQHLAVFSVTGGLENFTGYPLWMDGSRGWLPPQQLFTCKAGTYKDQESLLCRECPRGMYCEGGLNSSFAPCQPGFFSPLTGAAECQLCPVGRFAADGGAMSCSPCQPGFFAQSEGSEACLRCAKGSFMPETNATVCLKCAMNQETPETGSDSGDSCRCPAGTFLCGDFCEVCPEGLVCPAGRLPPQQQWGTWAPEIDVIEPSGGTCPIKRLICQTQVHCPEGEMGRCAIGRQGKACGTCLQGFYPLQEGTCAECSPTDSMLLGLLLGVCLLILVVAVFPMAQSDMNHQSLNVITVAAIGSQMVMAVQALGSLRQLPVIWPQPFDQVLELVQLFTLDLDVLRVSCVYYTDGPIMKFVGRLLVLPVGFLLLLAAWVLCWVRGYKVPFDTFVNFNGMMIFSLFIALTLTVVSPLRCVPNPDGSRSVADQRSVLCFESEEHWTMVALSITGIIIYPVAILAWATYATITYPQRMNSPAGIRFITRYRFFFQRFKPECYFYGLLLFSRNTLVALIPLMFIGFPSFQVLLMGCLFLASTVLQIRTWPWRTWGANWSDTFVLAFLQVVLLAVSPLLEMDQERSARVMGWLMTSAVMLCLSAGVGSSLIVLLKRWYNRAAYGLFLCHHKRGAGSFCRLIKVLAAQNSAATVFLDSDHLEDLDLLFDIVRCQTRTLVVVLSGDVLRRMWCAGEIATANKNKVRTVMLKCEDSQQLSEELIRDIPSSWRQAERQTLSSYGISMEDIQEAYRTLRDLPSVQMRRFGPPQERREKVIELLRVSQVTRNMLTGSGETEMKKQRARILVTGSVMDAEALAACEVFQVLVQQHIQVECAMVTKRGELMARRPWARYLAVLLSGDILTDPGFARILLADAECEKPLEMVTICADADFAFPNSIFYKELEQQGFVAAGISPSEGCALVKAWKSLCQVLALPLTPQGSERILGEQVVEICRRFRHYQDALKGHGQDSMMDLSVVPQDVDVEEDGWKSVLPVQVTRSDSDPDSPYQSRVSVLRKSNFILPSRLSL